MDNQHPSSEFRTCKKCGEHKTLAEFPSYVDKGTRRWRHDCSSCRSAYSAAWARGEIKPIPKDTPFRTCKQCGEIKPTEDFAIVYAKNSRGQNYRQHTCQPCAAARHAELMRMARGRNAERYREHQREHRQRHLHRVRQQRRESGKRLKDEVYAAYGGYRCVCCNETCQSMLTLDHIDENGAEHRNTLNGGLGRLKSVDMYRRLKDAGYPADMQVLCYNCNLSKHRNGGVCEHKTQRRSNDHPFGE